MNFLKRLFNRKEKEPKPRTSDMTAKYSGIYYKGNLPSYWHQKHSWNDPPIIAYSYDRKDGMHVYRNIHSCLWGVSHKDEVLSTPDHPIHIRIPMCSSSYIAMAAADDMYPIGSIVADSAE